MIASILAGTASTVVNSNLASNLVSAGLEYNEHQRSNFLHRESILQSLRIHECETQASKEYHRVDVKQSNDQHARELLQSKVQHEESLDNDRRAAIRENLRDEWSQITEKAETVLIVNTLILGVGFTMLIEGQVPDAVVLEYPVIAMVYLNALAICLATLLLSVRYSMVLRFRVGSTIVSEMRDAIHRALIIDKRFRSSDQYKQCNRAKITIPACDDVFHATRLKKVQSLPRQIVMSKLEDARRKKEDDANKKRKGVQKQYAGKTPKNSYSKNSVQLGNSNQSVQQSGNVQLGNSEQQKRGSELCDLKSQGSSDDSSVFDEDFGSIFLNSDKIIGQDLGYEGLDWVHEHCGYKIPLADLAGNVVRDTASAVTCNRRRGVIQGGASSSRSKRGQSAPMFKCPTRSDVRSSSAHAKSTSNPRRNRDKYDRFLRNSSKERLIPQAEIISNRRFTEEDHSARPSGKRGKLDMGASEIKSSSGNRSNMRPDRNDSNPSHSSSSSTALPLPILNEKMQVAVELAGSSVGGGSLNPSPFDDSSYARSDEVALREMPSSKSDLLEGISVSCFSDHEGNGRKRRKFPGHDLFHLEKVGRLDLRKRKNDSRKDLVEPTVDELKAFSSTYGLCSSSTSIQNASALRRGQTYESQGSSNSLYSRIIPSLPGKGPSIVTDMLLRKKKQKKVEAMRAKQSRSPIWKHNAQQRRTHADLINPNANQPHSPIKKRNRGSGWSVGRFLGLGRPNLRLDCVGDVDGKSPFSILEAEPEGEEVLDELIEMNLLEQSFSSTNPLGESDTIRLSEVERKDPVDLKRRHFIQDVKEHEHGAHNADNYDSDATMGSYATPGNDNISLNNARDPFTLDISNSFDLSREASKTQTDSIKTKENGLIPDVNGANGANSRRSRNDLAIEIPESRPKTKIDGEPLSNDESSDDQSRTEKGTEFSGDGVSSAHENLVTDIGKNTKKNKKTDDNTPLASTTDTPTKSGVMADEDTRRARDLQRELKDIERSYQILVDLRLRQDKFLNKKLDLLRRNWCKPYDAISQNCFMLGTLILLLCACILVTARWNTRQIQPLDYIPDYSTLVLSFTTLTLITVSGFLFLEVLLTKKHRSESEMRKLKKKLYYGNTIRSGSSSFTIEDSKGNTNKSMEKRSSNNAITVDTIVDTRSDSESFGAHHARVSISSLFDRASPTSPTSDGSKDKNQHSQKAHDRGGLIRNTLRKIGSTIGTESQQKKRDTTKSVNEEIAGAEKGGVVRRGLNNGSDRGSNSEINKGNKGIAGLFHGLLLKPTRKASKDAFGLGEAMGEDSMRLDGNARNTGRDGNSTAGPATGSINMIGSMSVGSGSNVVKNGQKSNFGTLHNIKTAEQLAIYEIERELHFLEYNVVFDFLPYRFTPLLLGTLIISAMSFVIYEYVSRRGYDLIHDDDIVLGSSSVVGHGRKLSSHSSSAASYHGSDLFMDRLGLLSGHSELVHLRVGGGKSTRIDQELDTTEIFRGSNYIDLCFLGANQNSIPNTPSSTLFYTTLMLNTDSELHMFQKVVEPPTSSSSSSSSILTPIRILKSVSLPVSLTKSGGKVTAMGCLADSDTNAMAKVTENYDLSSSASGDQIDNSKLLDISIGTNVVATAVPVSNVTTTEFKGAITQMTDPTIVSTPSTTTELRVFSRKVFLAFEEGIVTAGYVVERLSSLSSLSSGASTTNSISVSYEFLPVYPYVNMKLLFLPLFPAMKIEKIQPRLGAISAILDVNIPYKVLGHIKLHGVLDPDSSTDSEGSPNEDLASDNDKSSYIILKSVRNTDLAAGLVLRDDNLKFVTAAYTVNGEKHASFSRFSNYKKYD